MRSRHNPRPISRVINYPYPYPYPYPYFLFLFGFLALRGTNRRNSLVASSRSIFESAIAKVSCSHLTESGFGFTPFKRRKTKAAPKAVRLFPSRNG